MHKDSAVKMLRCVTIKSIFIVVYYCCAQRQIDCVTVWGDRLCLLSLNCLHCNNASVDRGGWPLFRSEYISFFFPETSKMH